MIKYITTAILLAGCATVPSQKIIDFPIATGSRAYSSDAEDRAADRIAKEHCIKAGFRSSALQRATAACHHEKNEAKCRVIYVYECTDPM